MAMKCCTKFETAKERCPVVFPRSSIKCQGHTGQNITDFDPNWAFPDYRPVAAFKSLRFALFYNTYVCCAVNVPLPLTDTVQLPVNGPCKSRYLAINVICTTVLSLNIQLYNCIAVFPRLHPNTTYLPNTDDTDYTDNRVVFIIWTDSVNVICSDDKNDSIISVISVISVRQVGIGRIQPREYSNAIS